MKAIAYHVSNAEEVKEARNLNLKPVEEELSELEVYFSIEAVQLAFLQPNGRVKILIAGHQYDFKYEEEMFKRLTEKLGE